MWRPENWENPYKDDPRFNAVEQAIYEVGADAMLTSLLQALLERKVRIQRRAGCVTLNDTEVKQDEMGRYGNEQ